MFKKLTAVLLMSIMVLSGTVMGFAVENSAPMNIIRGNHDPIEITDGEHRAPEVCNGKAYHAMMSRGWGWVYLTNGNEFINGGNAFQCSGCYKVIVTQYDPLKGYPLGSYAISNINYAINNNGVTIVGPDYVGYSEGTSLSGYRFLFS